MLNFSDGVKINIDGEYKIKRLKDGYYVIGKGVMIPVDSYEEGKQIINDLQKED